VLVRFQTFKQDFGTLAMSYLAVMFLILGNQIHEKPRKDPNRSRIEVKFFNVYIALPEKDGSQFFGGRPLKEQLDLFLC
jgi:hypothetical protein